MADYKAFYEKHLDKIRWHQDGNGTARCAFHEDNNPSLSVNRENGLWHCFAGCGGGTAQHFAERLKVELPHRRKEDPIAAYDYRDEKGLRYQIVRFPPKRFRARKPNGKGGWVWEVPKEIRILYNQHRLKEVENDFVFVPEGEKDADTLTAWDYIAVTNPFGAKGWEKRYAEPMRGLNVVVPWDNDQPGGELRDRKLRDIGEVAKRVIRLELPGLGPGEDVTDWKNKGHTKEEFHRLVIEQWDSATTRDPGPPATNAGQATDTAKPARLARPKLVQLSTVAPQEVHFLWEPYIPLGKVTLLEGDPKVGKSWLALNLAAILTQGNPFPSQDGSFGSRREPASVVLLSAEDSLGDTIRRRADAAGADCSRLHALVSEIVIDPQSGQERERAVTLGDLGGLEAAIKEVKPRLVIIDPIQAYLGADVDMHRANEVRPIMAALGRLAEQYGCAMLVIRHLTKGSTDRTIYRGLGSIDIAAAARSILLAARAPDNPTHRVLIHHACTVAAEGGSLGYELREGQFYWTGTSELTTEAVLAPQKPASEDQEQRADSQAEQNALADAQAFLKSELEAGARSVKELKEEAKKAGHSWRTVERAKAHLAIQARKAGYAGTGEWTWHLPYTLSAPNSADGEANQDDPTED